MKINNSYKKLALVFLTITILLSPLTNVMADALTDKIIDSTIFFISPGIWGGLKAADALKDCNIGNLGECIPDTILMAAGNMIGETVGVSMELAEKVLNMSILSVDFFHYGFTTATNPYIKIGWETTRNISNAVLILALVAIAISIIIGNEENKAKKLLVNFIIIALLINFTPVICGFIIDGSNAITSSMLTGGVSSSYSKAIYNMFTTIDDGNKGNMAIRFSYLLVMSAFSLFAIIIFFLYAILFFARTLILWILIMVSPLAFATFALKDLSLLKYIRPIFPNVMFWDDWWESFLQWCFIGIPAGFSLYIGNKLLIGVINSLKEKPIQGDEIFSTLIAFMLPFLFLIVGFFMTISTGTKAATKLSGELTSFGKKAVGWAGATGLGLAAGGVGAVAGAVATEEGMTRFESAKAGFASGKYAMESQGPVGSIMTAGGKITGAGIGIAGGVAKAGKNWAIREAGLTDEVKDQERNKWREESLRIDKRKDLSTEQKLEKKLAGAQKAEEKIKSYDLSAEDTIKAEAKKGFKNGAVTAASNLMGGVGGGTIAGALGAAAGGISSVKSGGNLSDIKDAITKNAIKVGASGSDIGKNVTDATLGAAGKIAVEGIRKGTTENFKTMADKILGSHKEKYQTKEQWEKEQKEK